MKFFYLTSCLIIFFSVSLKTNTLSMWEKTDVYYVLFTNSKKPKIRKKINYIANGVFYPVRKVYINGECRIKNNGVIYKPGGYMQFIFKNKKYFNIL